MAAEIVDLFIEQGSDYYLEITILDPSGLPYDLVNDYDLNGNVRVDDTLVAIVFNELAGNGLVSINIPVLQSGTGSYSIELVKIADNETTRLLQGRVYIDGEVK